MSITKLIATVSLAMTVLIMVTSNQPSIYATTEDDGYTYPDDATEDEKEEIDEQEQEAWEDAGRPGDNDNDNDNDSDDESSDDDKLPTCKNGVVQDCQVSGGITCIVDDRDDPCMDIWYGLTGGGWPECCDDQTDDNSNDNPHPPQQTVVTASQNCDTWSYDLDIKLAGLDATSQLLDRMYINAETNTEIDKYNAEIDRYNAKVAVVGAEVDRFNAECAT